LARLRQVEEPVQLIGRNAIACARADMIADPLRPAPGKVLAWEFPGACRSGTRSREGSAWALGARLRPRSVLHPASVAGTVYAANRWPSATGPWPGSSSATSRTSVGRNTKQGQQSENQHR